jgi:hypothetical protein
MWYSVSWGFYLPLYIGKGKNGSKVNEKLKLSVNGHETSGANTANFRERIYLLRPGLAALRVAN